MLRSFLLSRIKLWYHGNKVEDIAYFDMPMITAIHKFKKHEKLNIYYARDFGHR